MMRKLDQRGVAALEFCIVAVPLFFLMFAIFDLGRYAITRQSLQALANAGARKMMINCYTPAVIANTSPSGCTDINTYFPDPEKQAVAPFLYGADLTPTAEHGCGSRSTNCYGISTRFHHDDADMGHRIERAERVHLSSVLAHS